MNASAWIVALAALIEVSPASPQARVIAARATSGATLERKFELIQSLAMQTMRIEIGGVDQVSQKKTSIDSKFILQFTDSFGEVADGRPTRFDRTFDEIHLELDLDDGTELTNSGEPEMEASSTLRTATARFQWVDEEQAFGRHFTTREVAEEFLPRLEPDADLGALLSDKPVAPGDTWSIPPARLVEVFAPGGRIPLQFLRGEENLFARSVRSGVAGPLRELFGGLAKGAATAKLVGVRKDGEREIAEVTLDLDIALERDQRDIHRQMLTPNERLRGRDVRGSDASWTFKGQGRLEWDLTAGHARSLEIAGAEDVRSKIDIVDSGNAISSAQELRFAGGLKVAWSVREVARKPAGSKTPAEPR